MAELALSGRMVELGEAVELAEEDSCLIIMDIWKYNIIYWFIILKRYVNHTLRERETPSMGMPM